MPQETIVISDANILFDILDSGLMGSFCELPFEKWTSDFVLQEINKPEQKSAIINAIRNKQLKEKSFTFEEITALTELKEKNTHLSITDCSVWQMARTMRARLLSGDKKLRIVAEADGVKVSGILFVFDKLIEYGIIDSTLAIEKLKYLLSSNPRLPREECDERLRLWNALIQ